MFELGPDKILIILAAAFIFLGPKELPAAARKIGAAMRQLRALQDTLSTEVGAALDVPTDSSAPAARSSEPDADHTTSGTGAEAPGFPGGPSSFS